MKKILVILLLIGCNNNDNIWSYETRKKIYDGCVDSADGVRGIEEYCDCVLNELMKRTSEKEMGKEFGNDGSLSKKQFKIMADAASECMHLLKRK
jgi:hypothetical protein|tara:strand:- start:72 stop:356 length:285 start_codon:yes stop_codon:yes gene_type:complete